MTFFLGREEESFSILCPSDRTRAPIPLLRHAVPPPALNLKQHDPVPIRLVPINPHLQPRRPFPIRAQNRAAARSLAPERELARFGVASGAGGEGEEVDLGTGVPGGVEEGVFGVEEEVSGGEGEIGGASEGSDGALLRSEKRLQSVER